jgi:hypothetical protein
VRSRTATGSTPSTLAAVSGQSRMPCTTRPRRRGARRRPKPGADHVRRRGRPAIRDDGEGDAAVRPLRVQAPTLPRDVDVEGPEREDVLGEPARAEDARPSK